MILILSNQTDATTIKVINWLDFYSAKYLRINCFDFENDEFSWSIDNDNIITNLIVNDNRFSLNDINAVWFRRFDLDVNTKYTRNASLRFRENMNNYIRQEKMSLLHLLSIELSRKYWLNHISQGRLNKTLQLKIAKHCGLQLPETIITNKKEEVILFKKKHEEIITKPIQETQTFTIGSESFTTFTKIFTDYDIENLPEYFMHSLFQKKIDKEFEIRTFFLDGKFYSMAMFTQNDEMTSVDFRNYNNNIPYRRIPYKLPQIIENKLNDFMKLLNINCGSFDLIKSKNGDFVFLELNPVGQFGMTSYPCNYNLEKEVALHLIDKNNSYEEKK